jgi:hypothetical protein
MTFFSDAPFSDELADEALHQINICKLMARSRPRCSLRSSVIAKQPRSDIITYQANCNLPESLLEQIAEQGQGSLMRIVINTAMQTEPEQYLGRRPTSGRLCAGNTPMAKSRRR